MEILRDASWEKYRDYFYDYRWKKNLNKGIRFPCRSDGALLPMGVDLALLLEQCEEEALDVIYMGINSVVRVHYVPMLIKCSCGNSFELKKGRNTCYGCGQVYTKKGVNIQPKGWSYDDTSNQL